MLLLVVLNLKATIPEAPSLEFLLQDALEGNVDSTFKARDVAKKKDAQHILEILNGLIPEDDNNL